MPNGNTALSPNTLANLPAFYRPVADPDGKRIAFYHDGTGRNELNVMDGEEGERIQLSDGEVPRNAAHPIAWGADSDRIYFHKDVDGNGEHDIHALTLDGDHEVVLETEERINLKDVGSNGRYLLYSVARGGQMNLYRYDLVQHSERQLTSYDQPVKNGKFDSGVERIAYTVNETRNPNNQDVYVADVDGTNPRRLDVGTDGCETKFTAWFPGESAVLIDDERDGYKRCGYYDIETESATWFGSGEYVERSLGIHPDGETVLAKRSRECGLIPVRYDVESGEGTELDLDDGICTGSSRLGNGFLANGDALLIYTRPDTPRSLYRYDLDANDYDVLIEPDYGSVEPEAFVDAEHVTIQSSGRDDFFDNDGETYEIDCLLYEPEDVPSGGIVKVHGGPHQRAVKGFNIFTQFVVSQGYTVLLPNFRGSTGRGREFRNAIHGDWGGLEQEDIAAAGRWLKSRDTIDEDKVGVYGISYGGYSVYMQLVKHPQLWATGIACVGFTDLPSMYEETRSHLKLALRKQMGDPEENAGLWRERSPLTHVERLQRPLLMIQGVEDRRCPITQTRMFSDALEDRGWVEGEDFVYKELEGEGHGSTDSERKIKIFQGMADYLDERL